MPVILWMTCEKNVFSFKYVITKLVELVFEISNDQKFKEALATLKALGESKDVRDEARYDNIRMAPQ